MEHGVGTTFHMCANLEGLHRNIQQRTASWRVVTDAKNRQHALEIIRAEMMKGRRVVPLGDACEGFSYETGCPGHPPATSTTEAT